MTDIRLAEKKDQQAWDEYVLAHPLSGPYHLFAWRSAVEKAYHHASRYLMALDDAGRIEGVLPLILVKPPFLQAYLVSLPFCDYGGPLTRGRDAAGLLVGRAAELAKASRSKLEIRCKAPDEALQSFAGVSPMSHKVRMRLELPEGSALLWESFRSKLRSQIRRPQKDGMDFRLGASELVDDFYRVFSQNMRELGSPVHAKSWIAAVMEAYAGRAHIGIVTKDSVPVAGGIVIDHRDTVTIPWASALSAYSKSSPNMLLYWGFLQHAADNGFKAFDFGRSTPGEGTYLFKQQWGAQPEPLAWYAEGQDDPMAGVSSPGKLRQAVETIWSKLPSAVTDTLGPRIRGFITL